MALIQHPAYAAPRTRLREALDQHRPGHMVFIIGPSGVGKTTMRHSVMREMFGNPAYWGQGRIPVIETFAMLPNKAYFSSRALAVALVDELHAPKLDWLLKEGHISASIQEVIRAEQREYTKMRAFLQPKRVTESEYWGIFQRSVVARGCKYVSIDQVTALLVNHRDTSPADHTLHLMALAEATGVMFIMTGVHSASRLWLVHSELRRRVVTIWVPPYSEKRQEDYMSFLRLLKALAVKYQLKSEDLLQKMASEILAATGGVFAEIIQLLERAKEHAKAEQSNVIHHRHVKASYYNDNDLETLWRDIQAFEHSMAAGDVSKRAAVITSRWQSSHYSEPSSP